MNRPSGKWKRRAWDKETAGENQIKVISPVNRRKLRQMGGNGETKQRGGEIVIKTDMITSVSYTHLDVYKRQLQSTSTKRSLIMNLDTRVTFVTDGGSRWT